MRVRPALKALGLLVAASIALAGCSADGNTSDSTGGGDQTLRLIQASPPSSFAVGSWSAGESQLSSAVYDTAVVLGVDATIQPGVAESWEYSDDRKTLTFTIREGTTFTDGETLDAAAVKASFDQLRTAPASSDAWRNVSGVEAPDATTVVVTLTTPDAGLLVNITGPKGAIGAPEYLADERSQLQPVGSGPYVLNAEKTVAGSKYVLDRNPDYWNVEAYPYEHVEVSVIADPTAAQNAIRSGQADVLLSVGTADAVAQFPEGQFNSGENKPSGIGVIWLGDKAGTVVPALADVRVRQAINLAFDRSAIATKLVGGASGPTNQVTNPAIGGFSEDLLNETPYDVSKAKELMADAGYPDGFSVTMPSTPFSAQYDATIKQSLADIGITVEYQSVTLQDFFGQVSAGTWGMWFIFNGLTASDSVDVSAALGNAFNPFKSTTPELETLLAAANAAPEDEQDAAFGKVNQYLVDDAWNAPLVWVGGYWVSSKSVTYTVPTVYGYNLLPFAPAA